MRAAVRDLDALRQVAGAVRPVALAADRCLPVLPALEPLLVAGGLRRGAVVAIERSPGAMALSYGLCSAASGSGSWLATISVPGHAAPGLSAAAELGLELRRMAVVTAPAPSWASALATLVDAIELVVMVEPPELRPADLRRIDARVRERGAVLVAVGGCTTGLSVEVRLSVASARWTGIGQGHGRLVSRSLTVEATGRGAAARTRRCVVELPDAAGGVSAIGRAAAPEVADASMQRAAG